MFSKKRLETMGQSRQLKSLILPLYLSLCAGFLFIIHHSSLTGSVHFALPGNPQSEIRNPQSKQFPPPDVVIIRPFRRHLPGVVNQIPLVPQNQHPD